MTYSMDLRKRVEATYKKNGFLALTAAHYNVSGSWVRRLVQRKRETGSLEPGRGHAPTTSELTTIRI